MLDAGREYSLQQTLDEHSSSITAVKFAGGGRAIEIHSATYYQQPPHPPPPASCLHEKGVPVTWGVGNVRQQLEGLGLDGKTGGI